MPDKTLPTLAEFAKDPALAASAATAARDTAIDGVEIWPLDCRADARGALVELLSTRDAPDLAIPHVYHVTAAPGSIRAWVYHARQTDRLCFVQGRFRIVLVDLRDDSPTSGAVADLLLGGDDPARLVVPPFVVHGVRNIGTAPAHFVNLPTRAYDLADPDKFRLSPDDPRMPLNLLA